MVKPTGVGKHQINMIKQLAQRDDVVLELLAPGRDISGLASSEMAALGDMKMTTLPWTARNLERMWKFTGWPGVDKECAGADWVYSPFEAMPPIKRIPRVATIHQVMWFDRDEEWYASWSRIRMGQYRLFQNIAEKCDRIICVSEYLKDRFANLFPAAAGRLSVVYNGVENIYFEAGATTVSKSGANNILVIGALVPHKGAGMLFNIADLLGICRPDACIKIASGSCSPDYLKAKARARKNIQLLDYCNSEQVVELMRDSSVLLQVSPTETFGMAVMEAMAFGLPVVAVDSMAVSEICGGAACLVSYGDAEAACNIIVSLFLDEKERAEMMQKGKARAERFRWPFCVAMLMEALRRE